MDITAIPTPDVLPPLPPRRPAYTDFERDDGVPVSGWLSEHGAAAGRVDGVPVERVELDKRLGVSSVEFLTSVDAWRRLDDHDHVLPVVGWGKQPRPWVATPAGGSLADRVGRMDLSESLWVGACLADALALAHDAGVVHGSLSPSVIHRHPTLDWDFPRLGWFGVAGLLDGESDYRAPEQVVSDPFDDLGATVDVYGLGVALYELLTGQLPYAGDTSQKTIVGSSPVPPSTVRPSLSSSVDELLLEALAKDPSDRYEDVPTFEEAILDLLGTEYEPDERASLDQGRFPLFDGDSAAWRVPCPDCGRSVTNTAGAFLAHWRNMKSCAGPVKGVPDRATCSPAVWTELVERANGVAAANDGDLPR